MRLSNKDSKSRWIALLICAACAAAGCKDRAARGGDHNEHALPGDHKPAAHDEHGDDHADHGDHDHGHAHDDQSHDHGDQGHKHTGAVKDNDLGVGIETASMKETDIEQRIKIPGTIDVDPDRRAVVSAPAGVRIVSLGASRHATVKPGELLAVLEIVEPEVRSLQMKAVQIRTDIVVSALEAQRLKSYREKLAGAQGDIEDERRRVEEEFEVAEARLASLEAALDGVISSLELAGLSPAQLRALEKNGRVVKRIRVFAPKMGAVKELEVAERPVHLGQTVDAGAVLFDLVALDELLVVGEAFEADLPAVRRASREELPVTLFYPAEDKLVTGLTIRSVESTLHDDDHTTHFMIPLPNRAVSRKERGGMVYLDWEHRAGRRIQLLVPTQGTTRGFVLPRAALIATGTDELIYKKTPLGFEPLEVQPLWSDGRHVALGRGCGLEDGDVVIVKGGRQLLTSSQKDGAGGGGAGDHGHAH